MYYLSRLLIIFTLGFLVKGYTEGYTYQLKGSYKLDSSVSKPVKYTLRWSENDGSITGEYFDNYFGLRADVAGSASIHGRQFTIVFPEVSKSVKTINMLTSDDSAKRIGSALPVSVVVRDIKGNPLTSTSVTSRFSGTELLAQKQEEEECRKNFGALSGYCGVYVGIISERVDRQNKCNLLFADATRLELKTNGTVTLNSGEEEIVTNSPEHEIGRIPADPSSRKIDILNRVCRNLPGINSTSVDCKRLNLTGEFFIRGGEAHFRGDYTIFDEGNKNTCRYRLSLDRQ